MGEVFEPTRVRLRCDVTYKGKTHWKRTELKVVRSLEGGRVSVVSDGQALVLNRVEYEIMAKRRING